VTERVVNTQCCIAGGGPAGIMLGLLLAREGLDVVVLEKHGDFFRDFRGDTIHPSTLDLIDQLGLREKFLAIRQSSITTLDVVVGGTRLTPIDFSGLRGPNRRIALMPQWDFLTLLAEAGASHPGFHLVMDAEVVDVVYDDAGVAGVLARTPAGMLRVRAPLTVAADGRDSAVRSLAGMAPVSYGVPIDVLWFRLPVPPNPPPDTLGYLQDGMVVITIPRPGYYQMGVLIPKGGLAATRAAGLAAFRDRLGRNVPFLVPALESVTDWEQVKLLSVQVDRLKHWSRPGLLCLGDAAHAMSPVFGVGVNYAIQDAVAAARVLAPRLKAGSVRERDLHRIQRRRELPVRLMQPLQLTVHKVLAGGSLGARPLARWQQRALTAAIPVARPLVARVVGRGFRPEKLVGDSRHR
jgi:2-polyprenyl-6-methoxyphenol hydroxylase-like FAD-dependent oxidoreductase